MVENKKKFDAIKPCKKCQKSIIILRHKGKYWVCNAIPEYMLAYNSFVKRRGFNKEEDNKWRWVKGFTVHKCNRKGE